MLSRAATVVVSAVIGAGIATAVCAGVWRHHETSAPGSTGDASLKVLACANTSILNMRVRVTNNKPTPTAYNLTAYFFTPDGKPYLTVPANTGAIPAGQSTTIEAGNPTDSVDWKPGLTCQIKVSGEE